ncbi:MAG: DUF5916 domain-containing protein [Bacteroidales bacterium]
MNRICFSIPVSLLLLIFFIPGLRSASASEDRRLLNATRASAPPVIDGSMRDPVWEKANVVSNFYQYEPHNDRPASRETEVRVLYDDNAVYIAAKMHDHPDSILTEMGQRDAGNNLNADRFYVDINPFDDGVNGFRFQVSASGVQTDSNISGGAHRGGDTNWDAVWLSEVSITDEGWIVEMKIPYSALRFPRGDMQEWGINFWREIRRTRETSSWNFVNRRIGNELAFMGRLNGINGVDPPVRLAFYPYLSGYVEKNGMDSGWTNTLNGGMDVKYGISPSFTMDMTLIPDFGQVQSDAKVLNLSPYEVKYDENRQFFTEGMELFGKADLFYSRRVGARPRNYNQAGAEREAHETIRENPLETRMINATKISGRTGSGLGLGFFNAMTAASKAILKDSLTGETREVVTQPFTNYNLVVVDQSLRNNSFVSLVNTNVAGAEEGYTANVTGTEFRLNDTSNMFRISGSGAVSQQYLSEEEDIYGHKYNLRIGKFGGAWHYNYNRNVISDDYDQNDMGFLRRNNRVDDGLSLSHNIFDPFWRILSLTNTLSINYSRLYNPDTFTGMRLNYRMRMLFDTRLHISGNVGYHPRGERDYFEPRVPGRFYRTEESYGMNLRYSTDYRKKIYADGHFSYAKTMGAQVQESFGIGFKPTLRISDRLNMSYGLDYNKQQNDIGYVMQHHPDSVYFGRRQSPTITNTYEATYIINNDLSLNFDLRHYWSRVDYDGQYYFLQENGTLRPIEEDLQINDINYNAFTADILLTWHFAPGSQMTLAWKNVIDDHETILPPGYSDNFRNMIKQPQVNSFSVRFLYYIDFQSVKQLNQRLRS